MQESGWSDFSQACCSASLPISVTSSFGASAVPEVFNLQFVIGCGDRVYHRLSAFDRDVKFSAGLDVLYGVELERDLTGCVGVQDERLAIGTWTTVPVKRSPSFR